MQKMEIEISCWYDGAEACRRVIRVCHKHEVEKLRYCKRSYLVEIQMIRNPWMHKL